ncbi:hypothetical protein ACFQY0_20505 [Haloferula chungangensis]|uniref:Uncharacterized protein n=1 Tax=Haloferula chungangensis TaxID=1048331 RepID=A0ABW2LE42_9BACT
MDDTVKLLDRTEWEQFVDCPFNPPDESISDDEFRVEYFEVEERLRAVLQEFGDEDAYGEGDFYLENGFGRTRGLGFELGGESSLECPGLIPRIIMLLNTIEPTYDIEIRGDQYDFYLYVSKNRIQAFLENPSRLSSFGLSPEMKRP